MRHRFGIGREAAHPRPRHARAPFENGTNASLFHSPMNLSGLNVCGSSQYRATQFFVNLLIRLVDEAVLTIIMKSRDADGGHGPSRDRERNRFPGFISNAKGGVIGAILRDDSYLELSSMVICHNSEICATMAYHREHPQGFVYRAMSTGIQSSEQVFRYHAEIRTL